MAGQRIRRIRQKGSVAARVTSIGNNVKRADTSRQIEQEDVFQQVGVKDTILQPPYAPTFLAACVERSNMLKQCIAAIVTNVALTGYDTVATRQDTPIDEDENEELKSFIEAPNSEESLTGLHAKVVDDYETFGYAFIEAIRDRKQRISLLRHSKAFDTRLLPKNKELSAVTYEVTRGRRRSTVTEHRAFRRFVQVINGRVRYFKEFGDQRKMDFQTGEYSDSVPEDRQATEILHIRQNSIDAYGVPRWINQLPSILGSRESEECNLRYFEDNTVPPMILSVAGGRLTAQSYKELRDAIEKQAVGTDRQHKMLLIEAVPERESLEEKGNPITLKVDKLTDARQSDGLFKDYDESNQSKIRSSFRLPPVAVGLSQDVTFATANVSAFIAESQVYLPLRNIFDEFYNKRLVNGELGLNLSTVQLVSRVSLSSNPETIIKSLTALNAMGALTPRMANRLGNQVLQVDLDPFPEEGEEGYEEWMDKPIIFVTKGTASDAGQAQKGQEGKDIEDPDDGDVGPRQPEHGSE